MKDWQNVKTDKKMVLGRYIVADVLNQVGEGMDWESISESWRGTICKEAIAEAVRLAREALLTYWPDMEVKDATDHECAG